MCGSYASQAVLECDFMAPVFSWLVQRLIFYIAVLSAYRFSGMVWTWVVHVASFSQPILSRIAIMQVDPVLVFHYSLRGLLCAV